MTEPLRPLHIAGLLVSAAPGRLSDVVGDLSAAPGVQVHAGDDVTGRLVVTIETTSTDEQEAHFAWVRTLRGVRAVDLVYHYFES